MTCERTGCNCTATALKRHKSVMGDGKIYEAALCEDCDYMIECMLDALGIRYETVALGERVDPVTGMFEVAVSIARAADFVRSR